MDGGPPGDNPAQVRWCHSAKKWARVRSDQRNQVGTSNPESTGGTVGPAGGRNGDP